MFNDLWKVALNNYNVEKIRNAEIKKKRHEFKLKYYEIRKNFNITYNRLLHNKKYKSLYKISLLNQINKKKNNEYIRYYNTKFKYLKFNYILYRYEKVTDYFKYLKFNSNFFRYEKVTDKVYKIYLKWEYVYYFNTKNEILFHEIYTKFYCKHDYPYEKYNLIYTYLYNNCFYLDSENRTYLLDKLMKLWNGTYY